MPENIAPEEPQGGRMPQRILAAGLIALCLLLAGMTLQHWGHPSEHRPAADGLPGRPDADGDQDASGATRRAASVQERGQAIAVVKRQFKAFQDGNFHRAMDCQSAFLRRRFGSTARFRNVITRSYPDFVRPRSVQFGPAQTSRSGRIVRLSATIIGRSGRKWQATYLLGRRSGGYLINGVIVLPG